MLDLNEVKISFNGNAVLRSVSFRLRAGEVVGLVGPSGAGKSVLLKIAGGVLTPDGGTIVHSNEDGGKRQASVGFLFQEGALFDSMTVIENVAFPLFNQATGPATLQPIPRFEEAMEVSYKVLDQVGLGKACHKLPGQLSGGMRRRVALARALVASPDLVLLDDPTGGLDPVAASVIMDLIRELHAQYRPTVVMVSHDIRRLLPRVERVLALFRGEIVDDVATAELVAKASPEVLNFLATRYDFEPGSASVGGELG